MSKNIDILQLAEEIMIDITNSRLPLHNILLKTSRLSLLLDLPDNINLFKEWAKYAEQNQFVVETFSINIDSARDASISISSANPNQYVSAAQYNNIERKNLRTQAQSVVNILSDYRVQTYNFVLDVYTKWRFGDISETIFEKKRKRTEPVLRQIFPDINQRLNSIEQNLSSANAEDWKNAIVSCRTLISDIADILNPAQNTDDKGKYINRLKDFITPSIPSETKGKLIKSFFDELKKRLEYTSNLTQGAAHQTRPSKEDAEDVVLYTYLLIADLMAIYKDKTSESLV